MWITIIQKRKPYSQDNINIVIIKSISFDKNISLTLLKPLNKMLNINETIRGININPKKKLIL